MRARVTVSVLLVMPAAFAYCGGSDSSTIDGGDDVTVGNDTGPAKDGSPNSDSGNDTGATDGGKDSGSTDSSSTDATDGGTINDASTTCTKPSDCISGFCCGTIVFNGGTLPNCVFEGGSSACTSTCNSNIALSCTATDTIRTCAAVNDCLDAGANYNKCCSVAFGDAQAEFCWNATFAGLAGGSCL